MDSVTLQVEKTDRGFWTYLQRSAGYLPGTPLHSTLKWFLEQSNLGNVEYEHDTNGDVVSMRLGRAEAGNWESLESAAEAAGGRVRAVDYAGVFAQVREGGTEIEYADLSRRISRSTTEWGAKNTEFHYAFELLKVLACLNKKIFNLYRGRALVTNLHPGYLSSRQKRTRTAYSVDYSAIYALGAKITAEAARAEKLARKKAKR